MKVFNNTNVPVDLRDRVLLPKMGLDYPQITSEASLTSAEKPVFEQRLLRLELDGKGRPSPEIPKRILGDQSKVYKLSELLSAYRPE